MEVLLNIFLIALCCVIIIDYLQFFESIKPVLSKLFGFNVRIVKPFSCSTCSTWWIGLIYLIIVSQVSIANITLLLLISACTPLMENLLRNVIDAVGIIINLPMTFLK